MIREQCCGVNGRPPLQPPSGDVTDESKLPGMERCDDGSARQNQKRERSKHRDTDAPCISQLPFEVEAHFLLETGLGWPRGPRGSSRDGVTRRV